jgi:hypothetical protein
MMMMLNMVNLHQSIVVSEQPIMIIKMDRILEPLDARILSSILIQLFLLIPLRLLLLPVESFGEESIQVPSFDIFLPLPPLPPLHLGLSFVGLVMFVLDKMVFLFSLFLLLTLFFITTFFLLFLFLLFFWLLVNEMPPPNK